MSHKVYYRSFASREKAEAAVNAASGRTEPYRETYVKAGPFKAREAQSGQLRWFVQFEEYWG